MNDIGFIYNNGKSKIFQIENRVKSIARPRLLITLSLVGLIIFLLVFSTIELVSIIRGQPENPKTGGKSAKEIRADYSALLSGIDSKKDALLAAYRGAAGSGARPAVLEQARRIFSQSILAGIIPYWVGTPWGFNGMTETPGTGEIACGYFVTTVLRDAGLRLERTALAQQASELIIQSLVAEENINRFSDISGQDFLARVKAMGPGLYLLGLDKHIGFLVVYAEETLFIHSSFLRPYGVVSNRADLSYALMTSRYRVLGNLRADNGLLLKWLGGERIQTKRQ